MAPAATGQRIVLGVEYDGTSYSGWQIQPHARSIQVELNRALSQVADHQVSCIAAGRTDAGVHASGQVVHFDTEVQRANHSWVAGSNAHLPADISVLWSSIAVPDFHARFSAVARSYSYRFLNRPVRPALERHRCWWVRAPLDHARMHRAAQALQGEHDFSAFRAASCQAATAVRRITDITVERHGDWVVLHCRANAFLHHMVRNITGCLLKIGTGAAAEDWLATLLSGRDRRLAGVTAPPQGLTLTHVEYPAALLPGRGRLLAPE